uniref:Activation-induced cytidine deaminase n=1 Tax=Oncorhynchus kisutch TaxID=8019 RepID=A0A8C7GB41_ONCKI
LDTMKTYFLCLGVLLAQKKFIYHYKNMRWAKGRHETYLCIVVKRRRGEEREGGSALCPCLWVTWLCSWSPCSDCSYRLAQFLSQTPNLRLRIYVSSSTSVTRRTAVRERVSACCREPGCRSLHGSVTINR